MKISIITLNYNKPQLTLICIHSLHKQYAGELKNNSMEIIVVDNKSSDNSVKILKDELKKHHYPNTYVIAHADNGGFGAGNNVGAKHAKGEILLFLNNDTEVMDDGIVKMAEYMETRPTVGILGGQVRNSDNSPQASAGSFYTLDKVFLLLIGMQRFGLLDKSPRTIEKVDWVKGALLMIRRETFEKIHGFDENIFMYTEDMELCFRAKKAGFVSYSYPYIMVLHAEHGSTNRTFAIVHIYEGLVYFYKKHMPSWQLWVLTCILKAKAIILIFLGKRLHKEYLVSTYEQALSIFR